VSVTVRPRPVIGALVLTAVVGSGEAAGAAPPPRCGGLNRPACPLQRFMREQVAAPRARGDLDALATSLESLVRFNPAPARFKTWSEICDRGASAARAARFRSVLLSCVRCHDAVRPAYNRQYRERPIGP
jgi:hypothetical protein